MAAVVLLLYSQIQTHKMAPTSTHPRGKRTITKSSLASVPSWCLNNHRPLFPNPYNKINFKNLDVPVIAAWDPAAISIHKISRIQGAKTGLVIS
jgi:hypothetical protein